MDFYSAYKIKDISPVEREGVFRNYKNTFYRLSICDFDPDEGISEDNFVKGITFHNPLVIQKKGDSLAIINYANDYKKYMIYKKLNPETNYSIYLENALSRSKFNYKNFLIEYKKAKNYDKHKLEIEYRSFNNGWIARHKHKDESLSFEKSHYYQNPYLDGKFVKYDSIFFKLFYE